MSGFSTPQVASILSAVVSAGNLILNMSDGTAFNVGPVVGPAGSAGAAGAAGPLNTANVLAYQTAAPATGATVAMTAGKSVLYVSSPLLAVLTIQLPPTPADGQFVRVTAANGITLLTVKDASGNSLAASLSLGTLGSQLWQYQSTAWMRLQ